MCFFINIQTYSLLDVVFLMKSKNVFFIGRICALLAHIFRDGYSINITKNLKFLEKKLTPMNTKFSFSLAGFLE